MDLQFAAAAREVVQKVAEFQFGAAVVRTQEASATVKVPSRDQDRTLSLTGRGDERLEIGVRVDDEGGARGGLYPPAITPRVEEARPN